MKIIHSVFQLLQRFLLILLGVTASWGGISLMIKPDGSLLRLPIHLLDPTPFSDYFWPGLMLFLFLGLMPLTAVTSMVLYTEWKFLNRLNLYPQRDWAWSFSIYSGMAAVIWILVQIQLIGYLHPLQLAVAYLGLALIAATLIPSVMQESEK